MTAIRMQIEQGTQDWLDLRKTKITATDAAVIMGMNPWKSKQQLYQEKQGQTQPIMPNARMQRGTELEPIARQLFILETGIHIEPVVVVKDWAMASLDGMSLDGKTIVEIKCPGEQAHATALQGRIPDYYCPQLQHQMYVCDADSVVYYSFDGHNSVSVVVHRDNQFIEKMVVEELKFLKCLEANTPPEGDYIERDDELWIDCATQYTSLQKAIKEMEEQAEELKKRLIFLSGESNSKGGGISLCQIERKGNVDYSKVPQLKGVDLEPYRKTTTITWRITHV